MLKALPGFVIVKQKEDKLAIALADEAKGRSAKGEVISVGKETMSDSGVVTTSPVRVGDIVGYKKYQANDYEYQGEEYKVVHFNDLLLTEDQNEDN